jgi:radical SAM protein with 4Fe4S-binding SPASM domain
VNVEIELPAPEPPASLLIEITSRCNLKCRMCPLTSDRTPSSLQPGNLSEALWETIVAFAQKAGHVIVAGYGEPLLNGKCLDYLRELDGLGVRTSLTTNGLLVTAQVAAELAALRHLADVNVSIDSPDPAIYRDIRGGNVEKALEGARHLARALQPSQITVSSVMMRSNIESLVTFPSLLASMGIRKYVLQGLVDYTPGLDAEEVRWRNGLPESVARLRRASDEAGVELTFALPERVAAELKDPSEALARQQAPADGETKQCFAPWDVPVIDKDGKVFPCCYALSNATAILGDLNKESGERIWTGPEFQAFRRALLDPRTTPDVCRTCTVVRSGPHPLSVYSARIVHDRSVLRDRSRFRLVLQNLGTASWTREDRVLIGTAGPRDGASAYYHATWIGRNRVTSFSEEVVPPGGHATFDFEVTHAPQVPSEAFQVVVENQCWVPGTRFEIRPGDAPATTDGLPSLGHRIGRKAARLISRLLSPGSTGQ